MNVTITVTFEDGNVRVEGPLHDKMFCFGLLEMAKQAVVDHKASLVEAAPVGLKIAGNN